MIAASAGDHVFGGALLAAPDGYSYLAKMQLGASGAWLYTLRFTPDPGPAVSLFTFYIALGHIARLTGFGVQATYALARLVTGAVFLLTAWHVLKPLTSTFDDRYKRWLLFILASGLGWLVTPLTGALSPDLWVAESIPSLSLMANPHFPLAWALLLGLMYTALPAWSGPHLAGRPWRVAALSVALGEVYPMALPVALVTLGLLAVFAWRRERVWPRAQMTGLIVAGLAAAPRLLYTAWIVAVHPQLASWNAQNASPSPDLPLALAWAGPILALAIIGGIWALRDRAATELDRLWVIWGVVGLLALYVPYVLQRRLSLGLLFPLTMLAALAWQRVVGPRLGPRWAAPVRVALGLVLALSNGLVWLGATAAATGREPELFLTVAEASVIDALPADSVVAAAPDLAAFIPTRSMARVVYGHAAETPFADMARAAVVAFYSGQTPAAEFLARYGVTHVVYGPGEAALGPMPDLPEGWQLQSDAGDIQVYQRSVTP